MIVSLAVSKLAIALFLLRLTQFNRLRYLIWGLIAFLFLSHVPFLIAVSLQCIPVRKFWSPEVPGKCWPKSTVMYIMIGQGGECCPLFSQASPSGPLLTCHKCVLSSLTLRSLHVRYCCCTIRRSSDGLRSDCACSWVLASCKTLLADKKTYCSANKSHSTAIICCVRTGLSYVITSKDKTCAFWTLHTNAIIDGHSQTRSFPLRTLARLSSNSASSPAAFRS